MRIVLLIGILWFAWMAMMLVHEAGHVIGANATGGRVRRVVWSPLSLSRTDVSPNPHPAVEVWAGPMVGVIVPVSLGFIATLLRIRMSYLIWAVAGFCLIANGAYIGIGVVIPVGDAKQLISLGVSRLWIGAFGAITLPAGLWIWHRISNQFIGRNQLCANRVSDAILVMILACIISAVSVMLNWRD